MKDTTTSVDVAKSVFGIAVSLHPGHVAETHRLVRPGSRCRWRTP